MVGGSEKVKRRVVSIKSPPPPVGTVVLSWICIDCIDLASIFNQFMWTANTKAKSFEIPVLGNFPFDIFIINPDTRIPAQNSK